MPKKRKLLGLISYQPRWGLTIRGWLGILSILTALFLVALFRLQPFFAHTSPINAQVLIVEAWIGDDALKGAIAEFESQPYQLLITAGSDLERGAFLSEYGDLARLSEATLIALGFAPQNIQPIRTPIVQRDRTLTSARAVKQWLQQNRPKVSSVNLYSDDVHSRRSWIIYRKALEPEIEVGVIAHPTQKYDPKRWWASSSGFKRVTAECIGYFYTLFL